MTRYSEAIFKAITRVLDGKGICYEPNEETGEIYLSFENDDPEFYILIARIWVRSTSYMIQAGSRSDFDQSDRDLMRRLTDFLCRVNEKLFFGSFLISYEQSEVYYYYFLDCSGLKEPTPEAVSNSVASICRLWRDVSPGLRGVLREGLSAKEGFKLCKLS